MPVRIWPFLKKDLKKEIYFGPKDVPRECSCCTFVLIFLNILKIAERGLLFVVMMIDNVYTWTVLKWKPAYYRGKQALCNFIKKHLSISHWSYFCFSRVSTEFLALMKKVAKSPLVMDVLNIPNSQRQLERLADLLGKIQKALGEYLERERASFPRYTLWWKSVCLFLCVCIKKL